MTQVVRTVDLAPTLLALAGLPIPHAMDRLSPALQPIALVIDLPSSGGVAVRARVSPEGAVSPRTLAQIDELYNICDMILGKSFCALGDAAAMPVMSYIKLFRDEFEFHVREKRCRVNRRRAELAPYRDAAVAASRA